MNKTAIKNFAIWARVQLIESAKQRAYEYEITEDGENKTNVDSIGGRLLSTNEIEQRKQLISQIQRKGYTQVMEEAAYTWFNRFIALRYMEVNGFLPSKVRVFTDENGAFKPEVLKEAMTVEIDGLDRSVVLDLLDKQNNEELYKYLLITQCNALNQGLPYMFEKISNWTELLFPANLLRADSVIGRMVSDIAEDDFQEEVEIIGWLYQYYISEKHEEVIDPLHGKIIKKEDIPAATQLFTTDWVVRYILDNSLGRYWIERNPGSSLASKLTYLVTPKSGEIETINERITPEELKVLDPCVGSGHFLSYAFDILLEIYRECGWSDRDAAKSILENNLYGLDIDDRATQLACFAVAMKARKYSRRILNGETALNIVAMQDSVFITDDFIHYFANKDENLRKDIQELRVVFNNAKEYGSIISAPKLNYAALYERIDIIRRSFAEDIFQIEYQNIAAEQLLPLVKQAEILSKKYDIVATNPPYMNKYSARLKDYINQHFVDYKGDLFSVFMFRNFGFCKENGYSGFMTPNVWMFIKSYEELRTYIIGHKSIATLVQMAKGAFFKEATVDVCAFVLSNKHSDKSGIYIRLEDFKGDMEVQKQKTLEALKNNDCKFVYEISSANFAKIPGIPIAYWWANYSIFDFKTIADFYESAGRNKTHDNNKYLRNWWEISDTNRWQPYANGGPFRRWAGNNYDVVDWSDIAKENYASHGGLYNQKYNGIQGVCWNLITSYKNGFRIKINSHHYSSGAPTIIAKGDNYDYLILAFLNSVVSTKLLEMLNPTLNTTVGDVLSLPISLDKQNIVDEISKASYNLSEEDWDSFETSWDFKKHPLV